LWVTVALVPLAFAAGWCGAGSKADRWLTALIAGWSVYSAWMLVWEHRYAWAVFVAVGALGFALWRLRPLRHGAGDDEREREADGSGERGDGGAGADGGGDSSHPSS
jgi:hypothetical protein